VVFKLTPVKTNQVETCMIKIERTGFIGVLNYIIMSFLEIRSSNLYKSKTTLPLFILPLTSFRFGFIGRQLLHVLQHLL
jgi:hypothetical protein